jgi:hypothetical protein
MKKFSLKLSRQLDAIHYELDRLRTLPNTPLKIRKMLLLRNRLRQIETKLKV